MVEISEERAAKILRKWAVTAQPDNKARQNSNSKRVDRVSALLFFTH